MNRPLHIEPKNDKPSGFGWLIVGLLVGLAIVFLTAGCSRKVYPTAEKVHDTVTIERTVRFRDTAIVVPGAGVTTEVEFPKGTREAACTNKNETNASVIRDLRNKQAHLKVTQSGNSLTIDCNCDSVVKQARLRDSLININQQHSETKTVVVEKKYVPFVVDVLAWVGGICLFVLLAYLTKKFWLK